MDTKFIFLVLLGAAFSYMGMLIALAIDPPKGPNDLTPACFMAGILGVPISFILAAAIIYA